MDFGRGQIVRSLAGHDRGRFFFVLNTEGDFLFLADGKERKVTHPKRKRRKHTQPMGMRSHPITQKIQNGEAVLDGELRKALAVFRDELHGDQGGITRGKK